MKVHQWLKWNIIIDYMTYCWNINTSCNDSTFSYLATDGMVTFQRTAISTGLLALLGSVTVYLYPLFFFALNSASTYLIFSGLNSSTRFSLGCIFINLLSFSLS